MQCGMGRTSLTKRAGLHRLAAMRGEGRHPERAMRRRVAETDAGKHGTHLAVEEALEAVGRRWARQTG